MKPDLAFDLLRNSHEAGRLAQAYVLAGPVQPEGCALAERVLQLLFCTAGVTRKPCGVCRDCRRVAERLHPDVLWIEPVLKSRRISIEKVREIRQLMNQTSFEGGWKACVIVAADRLTDQAGNAFLKTLEEPPGRSVFLLLTASPEDLLPTIRSRCQQITVEGEDAGLPSPWLERLGEALILREKYRGQGLGALSTGLRIAKMLDEIRDAAFRDEKVERDDEPGGEEDAETVAARATARYREMRTAVMRSILLWYRDILLMRCGCDAKMLHHGSVAPHLRSVAARLGLGEAVRAVRTVEEMQRLLEANVSEREVLIHGFSRLP
ncbi:MAG: hypothetical protein N2255_10390 [Kiritimatiellae bacterium]|nr:hypothetical protein [Kiritimatiellia bacterium]